FAGFLSTLSQRFSSDLSRCQLIPSFSHTTMILKMMEQRCMLHPFSWKLSTMTKMDAKTCTRIQMKYVP
ncbi:hypothetical protein S83_029157, partial [Arachis hypogaea]